ncbi:MAG: preprotein translocase subunit SecE [Candidatus Muproteobacteria bacterium RIFCSPHIGHO2_12_FULL_60_33]|uniref:Protein translocase subunit SecE n=1 Tax=Candidatus Muproteobacteria bacterium RIFCSPLOWO2_01_FULL_60_18 TaxID=1817768 RepID=A0A1F6TXS5_9PROT|nr:MAG: preprotein translocase subunit SecE [Candidatus Muproteobacteria bacterium RIFCSPLOWO2_01_FULL_60_18]OGI53594.1 MAG: preprotein translocase subunit SecE [Candidatus Muproteobacteria bacterium RIFCSPHIGHO2_12_FULL_60_33]OGI55435.1 MAG: preprotein translocase subunit SecE [Candidatus Muproteobacteria bacterium RIFCSPHIGHO2_02_FULL_60_13]OGI59873.1 MAG: preprotein translocase subunit SecE [Candidatus Muproteobacteria bacterium RIFCSPHIGHO2_01_FULL_61_200]
MTADKLKLILAVLIVAGGIGGFYYFGDKPDLIRVAVMLAAAVLAVIVVAPTAFGRSAWEFTKGARLELRKVVWPVRKETMQVTLLVFVMVILVAVYMWVIDWGLHKIVRTVTG